MGCGGGGGGRESGATPRVLQHLTRGGGGARGPSFGVNRLPHRLRTLSIGFLAIIPALSTHFAANFRRTTLAPDGRPLASALPFVEKHINADVFCN